MEVFTPNSVCGIVVNFSFHQNNHIIGIHRLLSPIVFVDDMMSILASVAGFPSGTRLLMYEEVKPNLIEKIEFSEGVLEKEMDELMDGDIIIVQKDEPGLEEYKKPTPKEYSRY